MRTVVIIQARMGSERYPRKVLKRIGSRKLLQHVVDRCKHSIADQVVLAIPNSKENDVLEGVGQVACFRGSETDVLSRYYEAALEFKAQSIVRVTGDCPLIDPDIIDQVIGLLQGADYVTCEGYPRGVWCEGITFESLGCAHVCANKPYQREHVTPYLIENGWNTGRLVSKVQRGYRLCVDEPDDMKMVRRVVDRLGENCTTEDIIQLLDREPELICNAHISQRQTY